MFASIVNRLRGKPRVVPPENRPALILEPNINVVDYIPDPVEDCFCGSERFFKACCGSREGKRNPPYGIFVTENYLDATDAHELRNIADHCEGERLMVIDTLSNANEIQLVEDERRVSDRVTLGPYQRRLNQIVENAFKELTQYHLDCELQWYEPAQLLRYKEGGFYVRHADSENMNPDLRTWTKTIDRDLSLLIYLNDDFSGGDLYFEKFNYRLRPKAGMAVLFPSDNRYMHEAQTITTGQRYAIVSWAAVRGVTKLSEKPPEGAICFNK